MYSEALSIMDRNTVKYMIDELKEELKQQQEENLKLQEEIKVLQGQIKALLTHPEK